MGVGTISFVVVETRLLIRVGRVGIMSLRDGTMLMRFRTMVSWDMGLCQCKGKEIWTRSTSQYQFGFKKKSSTSHAVFCLKETVDYYTSHGSNVCCSFLDASKAFDRLVHSGLFLKLLKWGSPLIFIDIVVAWYADLWCRVRWGDTVSGFASKQGSGREEYSRLTSTASMSTI